MDKIKNFFTNLDKTDLKIMTYGLKTCFGILLFAIAILLFYLLFKHTIFLYELGISVLRLSTYIAVEFIVCGVIADTVKKQIE